MSIDPRVSPGLVIMSLKPFTVFGISQELIDDIKSVETATSAKTVMVSLSVLERISVVFLGSYFCSKIFLRETLQRVNEIYVVANKNIIISLCERIFNI